MFTADEIIEMTKEIQENLDIHIPNATKNEQNYYLRGVIDALSPLLRNGSKKSEGL